jgi:hypothetical protein
VWKRSTGHTLLLLLVVLQEYQGRLRYLLSALETGLEQDAEMVRGRHLDRIVQLQCFNQEALLCVTCLWLLHH